MHIFTHIVTQGQVSQFWNSAIYVYLEYMCI